MVNTNIYSDIAARTGGDIYIGVVGPVRTGKSTFIKRFMETLVIPNIADSSVSQRATDELPQSAGGRTIMTAEPKFIPEDAVEIQLGESANMRVRLIDCVGYIVPSSIGYIEDGEPRMVATPWYDEPIPFNMAAELGTKKVITEHSTIGLVVTTDGTIGDIPRDEYEQAEERVVSELREINKPFVMLLNTTSPDGAAARELSSRLSEKYGTAVVPVNCMEMTESDISAILSDLLMQFPIGEIRIDMPRWVNALPLDHDLRRSCLSDVRAAVAGAQKLSDAQNIAGLLSGGENVASASLERTDLSDGVIYISLTLDPSLFYSVLSERAGTAIASDRDLMACLTDLSAQSRRYKRVKNALDEVEATGYGIVMPEQDELTLEEPEIVRQGGRYGVRLRASAPSIHIA